MSMDYLTLGPTPCDESCWPAGRNPTMERLEARAYRDQCQRILEAHFGIDKLCVQLTVKRFPHDECSYTEVCVFYNPDNEDQIKQAYWLEENTPCEWDNEARKYLQEHNFIPFED